MPYRLFIVLWYLTALPTVVACSASTGGPGPQPATGSSSRGSTSGPAMSPRMGQGNMQDMMKGMGGMMDASRANGERIAESVCASCHGTRGASPSDDFPNLAGQDHMYLIAALKSYRDGRRSASPMNAVAARLSDQQIHDIAMYYMSCGAAE